MPTISSLTDLFITAQEGFSTTLASSISSGATTVPLNSVSGYTDGDTIALVIDPSDAAKKQVVVGTVDSSGTQLTGCIWTEGTNQAHSAGASAVDYVTATHQAAMAKGAKVSLNGDGTLKDNIVTTAKINDGAVTVAKVPDAELTGEKLGQPVAFRAYRSTALNISTTPAKINMQGESFDLGGNYDNSTNYRFDAPYDGVYHINAQAYFTNPGDQNRTLIFIYVNGSNVAQSQLGTSGAATDPGQQVSTLLNLSSGDYVEVYAQVTSGTIALSTNSATTYFEGHLIGRTD